MKGNKFILVIGILIVLLSIGLPFCFTSWNNSLIDYPIVLTMYILFKCIYITALIFVIVWAFHASRARGHIYMLFMGTIILQLFAFAIRGAIYIKGFEEGFAAIIAIVPLIFYVAFIALLFKSNKKQLESDEKYVGKEIPVVSEKEAENRNKEQ